MVLCACNKPIEKVPDWLKSAKVEFVCNNCPNRQTKNIAFMSLDAGVKDPGKQIEEGEDLGDLEDED